MHSEALPSLAAPLICPTCDYARANGNREVILTRTAGLGKKRGNVLAGLRDRH